MPPPAIRPRTLPHILIIAILVPAAVLLIYAGGMPARAEPLRQVVSTPLLIPIGGGYEQIYAGFSAAAVANDRQGYINILVLPITFASNPDSITAVERQNHLRRAEQRRLQIEQACKQAAPAGMVCSAALAPILTRSDALDPNALQYFQGDLSAVFILDGDQTTAMPVINGTPVEVALAQAYESGVIVAGTNGGGSMLSATLLAGYRPGYTAANALNFGAADLWNTSEKHGVSFGIRTAIIDQHIFERGQLGRLLNAITAPYAPHLGVGIDGFTGVLVPGGKRLEDVFGLYTVAVLDAETYQASANVRFPGCGEGDRVLPCTPLLSLRNVLVHLLAPGPYSFDLETRQHSLAAPLARLNRRFIDLRLPSGSGALLLSGELPQGLEDSAVITRFTSLARAAGGRVFIYADGFPTISTAQSTVQRYRDAIKLPGPDLAYDPGSSSSGQLPGEDQYDAVLVVAIDQSRLHPQQAAWLQAAVETGKPVLMAGAASAMAGAFYAAHEATPSQGEGRELAVQKSFLLGSTEIDAGLSLLPVSFEPDILSNNRWGRLFSLAYSHPDQIALGLNADTAIEIGPNGAVALGSNVVFVLDLRSAARSLGDNQAFVVANGLLDVFAPGEPVVPSLADIAANPSVQPTPALVTATPTATATATATLTPTSSPTPTTTPRPSRTPRPTLTPPIIPPPSNPDIAHWMVAFGMLVVVVIVFGLLLNRKRLA
jgi:cyanophycinase-like exopeptidase